MSDITDQCDALKKGIRQLETDYADLKRTAIGLRDRLKETEETSRKNCDTKMELLRILADTADHLRVSKEGTNTDIAHRIWAAVNDIRSGQASPLLEKIAEHIGAPARGNCSGMADSIMWAFDAVKEEGARDQQNAAKSQAEAAKLLEEIDVLKADHQAAIEGHEKELNDTNYELNQYRKKYDQLYDEAKKAKDAAGVSIEPALLKHDEIINILRRLANSLKFETMDTRLQKLEQVCYSAESSSGVMCREENPWNRIAWVLNQMSCEIRRLRNTGSAQVHEDIRLHVMSLLDRLGGEMANTTFRTQTGEMLHVLGIIEKKAMELQDIKKACRTLKELL